MLQICKIGWTLGGICCDMIGGKNEESWCWH